MILEAGPPTSQCLGFDHHLDSHGIAISVRGVGRHSGSWELKPPRGLFFRVPLCSLDS